MSDKVKGDWEVCNHLRARNFSLHTACLPTSAGVLSLDRAATSNIIFTGDTAGQIVDLPDATDCLLPGHEFCIFNDAAETVTVRDFEANVIIEIIPGASCCLVLKDNSTPSGIWVGKRAQLSKIMIDTSSVVGVSGADAQEFIFNYLSLVGIPIKNEVAQGETNCQNLIYNTEYEFIAGSLQVFLDGNKLENGVDFAENPGNQGFTILLDPNDGNRLKTAPRDNERVTTAYCRRIIF